MIQEKIKYRNHLNEEFDLSADGIWVEPSALHDYLWSFNTRNRRIASFYRDITTRKLPVVIVCRTPEEGIAARNRLFEVTEKDVLTNRCGRLIVGDQYLRCFITGSEKSSYQYDGRHMRATLSYTAEYPAWVRETVYSFRPTQATEGLDPPADYPFDYYSGLDSDQLVSTAFTDCAFRMILYGPVNDPAVHINGHTYKVNCTVGENEHLTIDSIAKTITLTKNDGTQVNCFDDRDREHYIFRQIPPGRSIVTMEQLFPVDIILLEERSEPKWT